MRIRRLDLDLLPQLKAKELRAKRKVLSRTLEGMWTAMLKGRGMEFAGFRKYTYGDDASRIDWGASLRAKDTLVREFEEYKNVNVLFLFDVSDTMLFSSTSKLKAEHSAELIFNLAVAILDNGDSVGHVMYGSDIVSKEMPSIGRDAVYKMSAAFQNPANYGGERNFKKVVNSVNSLLKDRSLIVLVSDFIEMGDRWEYYVKMLSQKFDLIGIMIRDPRDHALPEMSGQFLLSDSSGEEMLLVDTDDYRQVYQQECLRDAAYIASVFEATKAGFVSLTTGEDMIDPILSYFKKRTAIVRG